MTDKDKFIAHKIKILREEGYDAPQAAAISYHMYEKKHHAQQGGMMVNGYAPNQKVIKDIREVSTEGMREGNLQPGYYQRVIYDDGTKDYLKQGDVYREFQRIPNYINYMKGLSKAPAMQSGGAAMYPSPYDTAYPSLMNNFGENNYAVRPTVNTEPDFAALPFATTSFSEDPRTTPQQMGSQYRFSDEPTPQTNTTQPTQAQIPGNTRYNIDNPYGGVDLEDALSFAGQGFGEGNGYQASLGTGLSLLKGARNFMSGYASGKENKRVTKDMYNDLYNPKTNYAYQQEGGKITNAEMMTGKYVTDEGYGNYNVEGDEYIKRVSTGNVQEVVGEKHLKNGKIAEGVNVTLEGGDKVLSDYTKIPAKDVKELKERYDLKLKKNATFADAQKAYDKKLGIQKETDFLTGLIEKLESNDTVQDATTKKLNEISLVKNVQASKEKLDLLGAPQSTMFDNLFEMQEKLPKKAAPGELLDEKGAVVEETITEVAQEGGGIGNLEAIAQKYGITPERAHELLTMQSGGEAAPQPNPEEVMQYVAQALQEGSAPDAILQELVQSGIDQGSATQMIQQVMQQLAPQETGAEGVPQEVAQEGVQAPANFSFPTKYTPKIVGYDVTGKPILEQETLSDVESTQSYTGSGYGKKMQNVEDTIKLHDWYFDTDAKKESFRAAAKKEGKQPEIEKFQAAYNQELIKRADKAGVPKEETNKIIEEVGFSGKGVQQFDGLFGAFTSTRPLYDFTKNKEGEIETKVIPVEAVETQKRGPDTTKTALPWMPQDLKLAPSSINPIYKEQIALPRMEPIKATTEPMLAEQERMRQTDIARVQQSGLPVQQQEALLAQGLASSQMAANEAIGRVEAANAQNLYQTENFNLGQRAKEDITNAQFNQTYQNQMMQSIANSERDWRNYYNEGNAQNRQNYKDIENINLLNAVNDQYQYIPGQGVQFLNNQGTNILPDNQALLNYDELSPELAAAVKKAETARMKAKNSKGYTTTVKTV